MHLGDFGTRLSEENWLSGNKLMKMQELAICNFIAHCAKHRGE
jgi:hypothetical protein